MGRFEAPAGIKLSPVYRFQAGNNCARTFTASGLNYANPTFNAEPMNARRTADINLIDLRIDRAFTIGVGRLSPFVDLYNISNANAEQNITVSSGANFLRPINIIPPPDSAHRRQLRPGSTFHLCLAGRERLGTGPTFSAAPSCGRGSLIPSSTTR